MEEKQGEKGSLGKVISTLGQGFFLFSIIFISMISFSQSQNESVLAFAFLIVATWLGIPRIMDYLKEKNANKKTQESPAEVKLLRERLENLETLMCRLDAEINSQLEQSLSGGKILTGTNGAGNSQMPTTFLNIAQALEGRYQVLRELGRGGMGIVFQAQDKQLHEQVAIKVLSPVLSNNQEGIARMQREVSAARRISHPNVIRIHDISEIAGLHFVSMEYFHGETLKEYLRRNGACSLGAAFQIAAQICDGLEAAHRQGVIHRDLKSQNVIINATSQIKIIDFGLAHTAHMEGMTATGLILGTPEYMSPEQVAGKRVDERSDIYALGIIVYELLTGKVPFTGDSAIAVGFKQLKESVPPASELNPQLSKDVDQVLARALEKDPMKRYRTVGEFREALETILIAGGKHAEPMSVQRSAESQTIRH